MYILLYRVIIVVIIYCTTIAARLPTVMNIIIIIITIETSVYRVQCHTTCQEIAWDRNK